MLLRDIHRRAATEIARRFRQVIASNGCPKAGPPLPFTSTKATIPSFSTTRSISFRMKRTLRSSTLQPRSRRRASARSSKCRPRSTVFTARTHVERQRVWVLTITKERGRGHGYKGRNRLRWATDQADSGTRPSRFGHPAKPTRTRSGKRARRAPAPIGRWRSR